MSACLYRHFSVDGRLLYVGISINILSRTYQHLTQASWAHEISKIEIERFQTLDAAWRAETVAIAKEKPENNRAKNSPPAHRLKKNCLEICIECGKETGRHPLAMRCMACMSNRRKSLANSYRQNQL